MPVSIPEVLDAQEAGAVTKALLIKRSPARYMVLAMLAGAYVGVAVALLLATAAAFVNAHSPGANLVKGSVFGVALALVVFGGAELFTGVVPAMLQGLTARKVNAFDLGLTWVASWFGNLAGSLLFAGMLNASGVFSTGPVDPETHHTSFFTALSTMIHGKIALDPGQLFWRAVLCNFLVCLGLWMAARASSDAAKLIVLWWALLAFVATGFEHSVANMTIFGIGMFAHVPDATVAHFAANLLWVTLGNIVGGGLLVGLAYSYAGREPKAAMAGLTIPEPASPVLVEDKVVTVTP